MLQGFQKGELNRNNAKNTNCLLLIKILNKEELLDPINLKNFQYKNFHKVWVKYTSLRMANRCENARPIQIIEIKKREEK